ncbi:MAG: hypothetical protein A2Y03_10205 [Omnitrophica WOR_2 bacterium GWF2_38_59]|nr:MAG: hypothetical protein A2Y03_10205 [Omnitrophica WOR_2 bacterium GWF2_38_59]
MKKQRIVFLLTVFVMLNTFIAGCGKPTLYSKWRKHEVSIDGNFDDWQDDLTYCDEKTRVNLGVLNDDFL